MRWVMHVAGAGHKYTQLRQENINEREKTSNCRNVDGNTLNTIFQKQDLRICIGLIWLRI
jgi:hypothetical protein